MSSTQNPSLMGLLISRPSVFVWGPEACLSTVSWEGTPSTKENHICGSVSEMSISSSKYGACVAVMGSTWRLRGLRGGYVVGVGVAFSFFFFLFAKSPLCGSDGT